MAILDYINSLPEELQLGIMAFVAAIITFGLMAIVVWFLMWEKPKKDKL